MILAFGNHPELLLESGGPLWIGVSFSPREEPKLKIYMNGKMGVAEATRWTAAAEICNRIFWGGGAMA